MALSSAGLFFVKILIVNALWNKKWQNSNPRVLSKYAPRVIWYDKVLSKYARRVIWKDEVLSKYAR